MTHTPRQTPRQGKARLGKEREGVRPGGRGGQHVSLRSEWDYVRVSSSTRVIKVPSASASGRAIERRGGLPDGEKRDTAVSARQNQLDLLNKEVNGVEKVIGD